MAERKSDLPSIAVLASGRGSNFEALLNAAGTLPAKVVALLSDQPNSGAQEIARANGIPTCVVPCVPGSSRESHEAAVLKALEPYRPRFLVMAGYKRILGDLLLNAFREKEKGYVRITNIHPSLLPAFPGLNSYAQAFHYGCKVAGVTVHLAEKDVDSGPICAQEAFSIASLTSVSEVERAGLAIEHRLYPETLKWVLTERFTVEKRGQGRVCVRPS